ncbi:DNA polymerase IV [Sporomusa ovata DSM 2662]|uniref:DNA polymerase IV n=1 Tax=Sporomusa ovata TaxID=2378 RepID=A0A0U1L274_9FIRM|nr:hypothetical protein [Sporomusa ovata]EQB25201.1 DNA polymerase IV [Sporomusa ovata DSM 2662]CQR73762.1 DNA polymerase IV [Sporomusa ovata]
MFRTILHVDLNSFYASVELIHRPELRDKPVAVCGDAEARHGIVLAKSEMAKKAGVKTGDVIWEARIKCPGLVTLSADFHKYLRFSRKAREIYADYTDQIESFGIDDYVLAESVAARLRKHGLKCRTVTISVRNNDLYSFDRQGKLLIPTFISNDIAEKAMELFKANYTWDKPIRSLGVRGADLVTANGHVQIDLFDGDNLEAETLEQTIDTIRKRFGHYSVQRCALLLDRQLTGFNPKDDHTIHPVSYYK